MSEQYNESVANHYSSYRPPLHRLILARVLSERESFSDGLDIGCGTGRSSVALAKYCRHVHGLEPAQSMLDQAVPHDRVTYLCGAGERILLAANSVDVVTFAGSLYYTKSAALVAELERVCRRPALVIPYDFDVLLGDVLRQLGVLLPDAAPTYDYRVNFSDVDNFVETVVREERVTLEVTVEELAHVLLSNARRHAAFEQNYGAADPFPALTSELAAFGERRSLGANIHYSAYRLSGGVGAS